MAITVGNLRFETQSAFERYFKSIRAKYPVGTAVRGKDTQILYNLLQHHFARFALGPDDVRGFMVGLSEWKKPCFLAIKLDGSKVALSTSRAAAYNATPEGAAKRAFRLLAKNETKLAKQRYRRGATCYHCGRRFAYDEIEMDHHPEPFESLLDRFLKEQHVTISELKAIKLAQGRTALLDGNLKTAWMVFHRREATLVPSCVPCNRPG